MNGETAVTTRAAARAAERGVVVVSSAGNQGLDPSQNTLGAPADGVRVVSVGAVNRAGSRAGFSSVGPTADGRVKPDVAAMGVGVKVASHLEHLYDMASGTSFSCPLTAGVVALILQAHPDLHGGRCPHGAARIGLTGGRARHVARLGHRRRNGRGRHAADSADGCGGAALAAAGQSADCANTRSIRRSGTSHMAATRAYRAPASHGVEVATRTATR